MLSFSFGHGLSPRGEICSLPKTARSSKGLFRRSAPSCWHRSLAARGSGQSLIITGSAWGGVDFVRKQLAVLRGWRQSGEAEPVRFLHSGAQGAACCGVEVFFGMLTCFALDSVCLHSFRWIQVFIVWCYNVSCVNMRSWDPLISTAKRKSKCTTLS